MLYPKWRDDLQFVLQIAKVLDITTIAVRSLSDQDIMNQLGFEGFYKVSRAMLYPGNPVYYELKHIESLRLRNKL